MHVGIEYSRVGVTLNPRIKWLTIITSAGMFIVLLAGALVTKTNSGRGCGDDWPLCNGKFIPAYTLESMLEYSHRAVSGIVGILVLITAIVIYRAYGRRSEPFVHAMGALLFTIIQAILGAMAVKWEQSSAVMALHFGFSLLAFSFTLLLVLSVSAKRSIAAYTTDELPNASFTKKLWAITAYSYIVVYIGAFVRHTESSSGCTGWPLCNGEVIPSQLEGPVAIAFFHRIAALILFVLIVWIGFHAWRKYGRLTALARPAVAAAVLVCVQVLSGAWIAVVLGQDQVYIFASLLHTTVISALFAVLCYLSIRSWQLQREARLRDAKQVR